MKVGSLFSGIGGLDLGLERAGMKIIWQVELDPFCQKVLKKHWPEVPCYGDIKEIDFTTLPGVDLICGGFPCQPVSCAGKRQGKQDKRWLWPEFYRAVCEVKPRWVLVENVPGLLSADNGRLMAGILGDLARCGYDAEWDLLPAAAFGAPHLRFRLFLVANLESKSIRPRLCQNKQTQKRRGRFNNFSASETCSDAPDASTVRLQIRDRIFPCWKKANASIKASDWWITEPGLGRLVYGISSRVDRIKALGNAVVPQVAEWIGRRIVEAQINLD